MIAAATLLGHLNLAGGIGSERWSHERLFYSEELPLTGLHQVSQIEHSDRKYKDLSIRILRALTGSVLCVLHYSLSSYFFSSSWSCLNPSVSLSIPEYP